MPSIHHHLLRLARDIDCNVFVESGTYRAVTYRRAVESGYFERVYTVEVVKDMFESARKLFVGRQTCRVFWGRTHEILVSDIFPLCNSEDRIFFWLDGHYSKDVTGGSETPCPLLEELEIIRTLCPTQKIAIAIDDTDDFGRTDPDIPGLSWPSRQEIDRIAFQINPQFEVIDFTGNLQSIRKLNRGVLIYSYQRPSLWWQEIPRTEETTLVHPTAPETPLYKCWLRWLGRKIPGQIKRETRNAKRALRHFKSNVGRFIDINAKLRVIKLRNEVRGLPISEVGTAEFTDQWLEHRYYLRHMLLEKDPCEFLTWGFIRETMFLVDSPYIEYELRHLQSDPEWDIRWKQAVRESIVGLPARHPLYPESSANLIHHAYSLMQYEDTARQKLDTLAVVLEFGGGYGSMCRLIHQLGFQGVYIIFDLPEFSALQRFYLGSIGIPTLCPADYKVGKAGVICVDDIDELKRLLSGSSTVELLIATWSLSEAPIDQRTKFLSLLTDCGSFLISYQNQYGAIDNCEFFDAWTHANTSVSWTKWGIPHLQGNNYLIGAKPKTNCSRVL